MAGSRVNLTLRFTSLGQINIFGTDTLLHKKLCRKGDIEQFTADSVIPECVAMKKGIRQISIISMAIKFIHKQKMNTEEQGRSNSCR